MRNTAPAPPPFLPADGVVTATIEQCEAYCSITLG
jgi:hypothetical protein